MLCLQKESVSTSYMQNIHTYSNTHTYVTHTDNTYFSIGFIISSSAVGMYFKEENMLQLHIAIKGLS